MVATVNPSFIDSSDFAAGRGSMSFLWTMVAFAALDLILLFWLFNPLAKPSNQLQAANAQATMLASDAEKPSPLGAVASQAPVKARPKR